LVEAIRSARAAQGEAQKVQIGGKEFSIDALVHDGSQTIIYSGAFDSYELAPEGKLDYVCLQKAQRWAPAQLHPSRSIAPPRSPYPLSVVRIVAIGELRRCKG